MFTNGSELSQVTSASEDLGIGAIDAKSIERILAQRQKDQADDRQK